MTTINHSKTTKYQSKDIRWKWLAEKGYHVHGDKHQLEYMQALWSPTNEVRTVFVDAAAGTGKTSLAVAAGVYAVENQEYDRIIYVRNAVSVRDQGFLPGSVQEKEYVYYAPLFDACDSLSSDGYESWYNTDEGHQKIVMASTSYLRGINFKNAFIIIDEAQNLDLVELQTTLTRAHDNCKVVVIGSKLQVDNTKLKRYGKDKLTPFEVYAQHFEGQPSVNLKLVTNYRGQLSLHADKVHKTVKLLNEE